MTRRVLAPIRQRDRYGELDPACIQVLNEIATLGGAEVVVSSTWRYGKTVAELQAILDAAGFTGRVLDKTPIGAPGAVASGLLGRPASEYGDYVRGREPEAWPTPPPEGARVGFAPLRAGDVPRYEVFAEGWQQGGDVWGRPVYTKQMRDGSLLIADDYAGAIYRIAYQR